MTMLLYTYNHGIPVLISDILLTSADGQNDFSLPTHLNGVEKLIDSGAISTSPTDLKQKVYIINDKLCVLLGGRLDQMFSFLNYLNAFFKDTIPSAETLVDYLKSYDKYKITNLLALIVLAEQENESLSFKIWKVGNWHQEKHDVFKSFLVGGSGANDFLRFARIYTQGIGHSNPLNKALTQNIDLLSKFVGAECNTAETILNKWGAGFEITYYFNGKFKKLPEYTFVLFNGEFEINNGLSIFPIGVLKYKYNQERLIVRAADSEREKLFVVNSINDSTQKSEYLEQKPPDYQSKDIILAYFIKLPTGRFYMPTFVILVDKLELVKLQEVDGKLAINVNEELTNHIESDIKRQLNI